MADIPDDVDLNTLLAPIPGDIPTGPDPRNDDSANAPYIRLKDARMEARAAERQADSDGDLSAGVPPQWRTIRSLAMEVLANDSKDLEIAAWLTEALVRTDGIAGLTAGSRVLAGLVEQFWDTPDPNLAEASPDDEYPPMATQGLYPMPDEDGVETRVRAITGLNGQGGDGTLIQPLRKLGLFRRPDGDEMPVWQYDQSAELSAISDETRRQQRLDAGVLPFDEVENEARAAGTRHFLALQGRIDAALQAWQAMADALDSKAGVDSPPTSRVRDVLTNMRNAAHRYSGEADGMDATAAGDGTVVSTVSAGVTGGGAAFSGANLSAGSAASREDALRLLSEIASFFQRTEPQSPIAYTLKDAVRRGRLTWPQLLEEVVPDYATRAAILSSLGIRPESQEQEE